MQEITEEVVESYTKIIKGIVRSLPLKAIRKTTGLEYDDLVQIGYMALITAGRRTCYPLDSVAARAYIRNKVKWLISREVAVMQKVRAPRELQHALTLYELETLTPHQIADKLGMDEYRAMQLKMALLTPLSTDAVMTSDNGDEEVPIVDKLYGIEYGYDRVETEDILQRLFEAISPSSKDVVMKVMSNIYAGNLLGCNENVSKDTGKSLDSVSGAWGRARKAMQAKAKKIIDKGDY